MALHGKQDLTPGGRDWVTTALDPFHDYQVSLKGLPDPTNVPTVIQNVRKQITISAPSGILATEKWSVHIHTLPSLTTLTGASATTTGGGSSLSNGFEMTSDTPGANSQEGQIGTVNVVKMLDGVPGWPDSVDRVPFYDASRTVESYSHTDSNDASMSRLVAGGFEVHNDTAALYRSGSVTVYSQPNGIGQPYTVVATNPSSPAAFGICSMQAVRTPPTVPSEAVALTDSATWDAEQGCYVPFRLDLDQTQNFQPTNGNALCLAYSDVSGSRSTGRFYAAGPSAAVQNIDTVGLSGQVNRPRGWREAHIETTGAYFSGLTPETVLTLTIRFIAEAAPTAANAPMLYMASPSAKYDPRALECYTNCVRRLPPGVPVDMNAKGDWWKMVQKVLKTALPVGAAVSTAFGQPEVGALLMAGDALVNMPSMKDNKKQNPANKMRKEARAQKKK